MTTEHGSELFTELIHQPAPVTTAPREDRARALRQMSDEALLDRLNALHQERMKWSEARAHVELWLEDGDRPEYWRGCLAETKREQTKVRTLPHTKLARGERRVVAIVVCARRDLRQAALRCERV